MAPVGTEWWMWWVGERLLTGSLQGAVVVALVWLVCRNIGAIPASARAFLWWLVSLKLVLALAPVPSLSVPLLPSSTPAEVGRDFDETIRTLLSHGASPSHLQAPLVDPASVGFSREADARESATARATTVEFWLAAAIGLWLAGVAALTLHLLRIYARLRGAVRSSTPIGAEDANIVDRLARLLALKKTPRVRVSDRVTTPLVVGVFRPTVLIPADALEALSSSERAMAICHEFAHVRRGDLLLGWVPALAERLFFFHPLARLAAREYVVAREAACDMLVLRAMDVAPQEYGRMLVRLGVGGLDTAFTAAGSSPSIASLRRRLDMLHHLTFTGSRRRVLWLLVAVSALTLVPLRLVARTPQSERPAAATSVPVSVVTEQAAAASPPRESTQTQPTTPVIERWVPAPPNIHVFVGQTAEDLLRQAEAEYRKAVDEYRKTAGQERTADFLKKEYEAQAKEYKTAVLNLTGNQEPSDADRAFQEARTRELLQQLQRALELPVSDKELQRSLVEKIARLQATLLQQKAEEARHVEVDRESLARLLETARITRSLAVAPDSQTGIGRQLEALTIAQQTLIEQLQNLAAQQDKLSTMQRQLSDQIEIIRRELERTTRAIARPPAAAPAPATAPPPK